MAIEIQTASGCIKDALQKASQTQTDTKLVKLWRPWLVNHDLQRKCGRLSPYIKPGELQTNKNTKSVGYAHPVKLFWPRSRCFDYLYQEAEALLRNYPVQATIAVYDDSSNDENSDSEEETDLN